MKDDGGGASFCCRRAALRFVRGATAGGFVLGTAMDSRRLCPGTPSNPGALGFAGESPFAVVGRFGFSGGFWPRRSDAARVMRGATTGGAVLATAIVSARLCPGTFANVFASCSFVGGARGLFSFSRDIPARSAAARDMRGTMSGSRRLAGTGRAL